jgi:hypothetical protein
MLTQTVQQENFTPYPYHKQVGSIWVIVITTNKNQPNKPSNKLNGKLAWQKSSNDDAKTTLEKTWIQAQEITSDSHIMTVATAKHKSYFKSLGEKNIPGEVIYQPDYHGSAAAVYLALAFILAKDPNARIVILPIDDYYKSPSIKSIDHINQATQQLADTMGSDNEEKSVFITYLPIHPNQSLALMTKVSHLYSKGIIISKAYSLWQFCKNILPEVFDRMEYVHQVIKHFYQEYAGKACNNIDYINMAMSHAYYHLPNYDFNNDLINNCIENCQVLNDKPNI